MNTLSEGLSGTHYRTGDAEVDSVGTSERCFCCMISRSPYPLRRRPPRMVSKNEYTYVFGAFPRFIIPNVPRVMSVRLPISSRMHAHGQIPLTFKLQL